MGEKLRKALCTLLFDQFDCPDVEVDMDEESFVDSIISALIESNEDVCPFKNYSCEKMCIFFNCENTSNIKKDCEIDIETVWEKFIQIK